MINVCFGSGPCAKHKGWSFPDCRLAGRSHRSKDGLKLIQETIKLQREILNIPNDYLIGITTGSCTGAMELLMWNLLGEKPVDVLTYCVFSNHWAHDIVNELRIENTKLIKENFPKMSDINKLDFSHDVVFCLSSTTSGVSFKNTNWIPCDRKGLTICDAASGVFIIDFDWNKLDAIAFSWQKGLGTEAGFGAIVLSPKAIERLKNFRPNRAIPRIFRIVNDNKINMSFFEGNTINTPSMLCFQELYETLIWVKKSGGISFLVNRVEENYKTVLKWIDNQNIFKFLVDEKYRAHHIACFDIVDKKYQQLSKNEKWEFLRRILDKATEKNYGYDFLGHTLTEPHIRIWCGPTLETSSLEFFLPKLIELYNDTVSEYGDR